MNKHYLNEIPERFHILFTTDWNKGIHSEMKLEDRIECEKLYTEYNKWQIQQAIKKSTPIVEEKITGFIKD